MSALGAGPLMPGGTRVRRMLALVIGSVLVACAAPQPSATNGGPTVTAKVSAATPSVISTAPNATEAAATYWQLDDRLDASGTVIGQRLIVGHVPTGNTTSFDLGPDVVAIGPLDDRVVIASNSTGTTTITVVDAAGGGPTRLGQLGGRAVAGTVIDQDHAAVLAAEPAVNRLTLGIIALDGSESETVAAWSSVARPGPAGFSVLTSGQGFVVEQCGLEACTTWRVDRAGQPVAFAASPLAWWIGEMDGQLIGFAPDSADSAVGSIVRLRSSDAAPVTLLGNVAAARLVPCGEGLCLVAEVAQPRSLVAYPSGDTSGDPTRIADAAALTSPAGDLGLIPAQPPGRAGIGDVSGAVWVGLDRRLSVGGKLAGQLVGLGPSSEP